MVIFKWHWPLKKYVHCFAFQAWASIPRGHGFLLVCTTVSSSCGTIGCAHWLTSLTSTMVRQRCGRCSMLLFHFSHSVFLMDTNCIFLMWLLSQVLSEELISTNSSPCLCLEEMTIKSRWDFCGTDMSGKNII